MFGIFTFEQDKNRQNMYIFQLTSVNGVRKL